MKETHHDKVNHDSRSTENVYDIGSAQDGKL